MKKVIQILFIIILICLIFSTEVKAVEESYYSVDLNGKFEYTKAYEVLDIVNEERKAENLPALTMDEELLEVAMLRAAETSIYFSHTRPTGKSCFSASYKMSGENISAGNVTAKAVMESWMNSEGHKANILNSNYKSIGIGCFYINGVRYWVQCFGFSSTTTAEQPDDITKIQEVKISEDYLDLKEPTDNELTIIINDSTTVNKVKNINIGWNRVYAELERNSFNWKSSDTSIATVSNGTIKGVGVGQATITATLGSTIYTYNLHVTLPFKDVSSKDYYYGAVNYCYKNKIISGTTDTTFSPGKEISRGMLVTILWRMEGCPTVTKYTDFTDVSRDSYYYKAVQWAASKGIVSGYGNGRFGPNDSITRQQLAVMLRNYANYKGKNTDSSVSLTSYTDYKDVATWAKTAMQWATKQGVINGSSSGEKTYLKPTGTATRAQGATMIYNYCLKVK